MTHKNHKEGMEERFDDKFRDKHDKVFRWGMDINLDIKSFIREELSHQLTKIQEMVEGLPVEYVIKSSGTGKIDGRATPFINKESLLAKLKEIKQ